ncbi:hypothetical protein P7H70_13900 [Vagococcus carniphilus]|uniref:Uncharacterized protein n=1 Tax=Vagococcus carniphilus TaxID=218144 RepID=A0AAW8UAA0_9ENTE|nr:hypothetical protein [Vagococcus carniphilus]MDT2835129.1 hypothetical protein [Vagococcus carniphilus]
MRIKVNNPYYDETYETEDINLERWKNFIENKERGNEEIISFTDNKSNNFVTLNPSNFSSIEVSE